MLYLVPTPIGNLEDITLRAIRILKEADVILAEDTRKTGILLKHYDIDNKLQSYHQFNEHKTAETLVQRIAGGETMALVTDAGTPGISDPGFYLIRACLESDVKVECLPGATAFVPAMVNSGLPSDHFVFEGFLPPKKGRQTKLNALSEQDYTMVFYESPHRLLKTLQQFSEVFGADRKACVSRELTKIYEENTRGTLEEIIAYYKDKKVKGEIVIIVSGKPSKKDLEKAKN
ncbi:MAG: 16S rRNA (cytidine(1402)-2'-O)-methyltransferase [Bacteroidetes bacterium]|nr:16S rRNA (cytidine(1402)-2'-O)-methyltransferase [Bacteroidota bacterium]